MLNHLLITTFRYLRIKKRGIQGNVMVLAIGIASVLFVTNLVFYEFTLFWISPGKPPAAIP